MDDKTVGLLAKFIELTSKTLSFESMTILLVISLFILKAPNSWWDYFNIELPQEILPYTGGVFIFSLGVISVKSVFSIGRKFKEKIESLSGQTYTNNIIDNLNQDEILCLSVFFIPKMTEIVHLNENSIVVIGLINKEIIAQAAIEFAMDKTPFQISREFKPYLTKKFSKMKKRIIQKQLKRR